MEVLTDESDYTCTLDEASLVKAKKELNESDKERDGCVRAFRSLVKQQPWIKSPLGTQFLLKYLRTQKYSQLGARTRLEQFFTNRTETPAWFAKKDPRDKNIQELIKCGFILRLPRTDKDGRIFIMSRPGQLVLKRIDKELGGYDTVFRAFTTVLDWVMMDERAQVNGLVIIMDGTGFTMDHRNKVYTVENLRRMIANLQNCYPFRVKQFHFYNPPKFFEALFAIVRGFLKEKLRDRINIHGKSMVSLYDKFDMSVLPDEYLPDDYTGPSSGSVQSVIDYMIDGISKPEVAEFIRSLSTYGIDERHKPKEAAPVASFRKLNVD